MNSMSLFFLITVLMIITVKEDEASLTFDGSKLEF